jgi:tRNA (guanine-N7-)-methyltransferase
MKRTDLRFPFSWEERRPALSHRVLFVPAHYFQHEEWVMPAWHDEQVFGNDHPVVIEYCSGNGDWILERAVKHPEINWVAVEQKFERVSKIWVKAKRLNLANLLVVCGEALTFTKYYVRAREIDRIYVNFPDPWPKERHAKHRLIQQPFVLELARIVKKGGLSVFVTDFAPYASQMCQEMLDSSHWLPSFPDPFFKTEWQGYGNSYFDSLWREKGCTIHYIQFENRHD